MPQIQLKLEVSPNPKVVLWSMYLDAGDQILQMSDFAPINGDGFYVWNNAVSVNAPSLLVKLHISGPGSDTLTPRAVCYVTINGVAQQQYLRCLLMNGQLTTDDQLLFPIPAGAVPPSTGPTPASV